jgi:tetratricopeptide (TPR) repeat protein
MSQPTDPIQEILSRELRAQGYQVDLVPVPARGDRMVRIRTLEEALEEYDHEGSETLSYLVQLRPARVQPEAAAAQGPVSATEGIYLADGRLNVAFLQRNAELLIASRDFALARNIFTTLLHSGERSDLAHYGLGRCHEAEGNLADAVRHYDDSIAYQPTYEAYRRLSAVLMRWKKDQNAAEVLRRALNLRTISEDQRFELNLACGNCWLRSERTDQAEKHYRAALQLRPENGAALTNLGALYLQMGKTAEARQLLEQAAAQDPANAQAHSGIATAYLAEGQKRLAHDHFARALEANLNNPNAVYHLVKLAYELKTFATAARILGEYIQVAPVNINLLYSLAGMQFHLGRLGEARSTAERILSLQAQHSGANDLLRRIQHQMGGN